MARHEADREDLWAEAVALTARVELAAPCCSEPIVVGYRPNSLCSFYFGQDVMLQFTTEGSLRRAYRDGELYRTQGTTLARLQRQRSEDESALLRSDLTTEELSEFRAWMIGLLRTLLAEIQAGRVTALREIAPPDEPLLERIAATLNTILTAEAFLAPPIVRGR